MGGGEGEKGVPHFPIHRPLPLPLPLTVRAVEFGPFSPPSPGFFAVVAALSLNLIISLSLLGDNPT